MTIDPVATYRLQLRNGVGLDEACALVPYLHDLGISHLYLSPILKAREGSSHGYDGTDPRLIDPALGGEPAFEALAAALARHGMGLLLDIVPNHLAASPQNPFWFELLRDGRFGPAAAFFDVDWEALAGGRPGKLLLPILGRPLREVVEADELSLESEPFAHVRYHEHRLPIAPGTGEGTLETVLERQHWQLAWWRCASERLNWRRFFDITELAGVRVEEPAVFDEVHARILAGIAAGAIQGLRIDHVDGLSDPVGYLARLDAAWRARSSAKPWILVEKIVGAGEDLPPDWPVAGTTGYEILNAILRLLIDPDGMPALNRTFEAFGGDPQGFEAEVRCAKRQVLTTQLQSEVRRLASLLAALPQGDFPPSMIEEALVRLITAFPWYRTYGAIHRERLEAAIAGLDALDAALPGFLLEALDPQGPLVARLEQLTGPATAKALEDTAFYRWHRFTALNEVGGEPDHATATIEATHALMSARQENWPLALIATATHDTKRGEDTRLRIAALSHCAGAWEEAVQGWRRLADPHRRPGGPDDSVLYLLFQTLIGIWPEDGRIDPLFSDRLGAYALKAAREAKLQTSWLDPDEGYEQALAGFIERALADRELCARIDAFVSGTLLAIARSLSMAQLVLKLTLPGVPDIYQGTETTDLSLVDPDNRRPVDFAALAAFEPSEVKQQVIRRLLSWRRQHPDLFTHGHYLPLAVHGQELETVFAFARKQGEQAAIVLASIRPAREPARIDLDLAPLGIKPGLRLFRSLIDDSEHARMAGSSVLPWRSRTVAVDVLVGCD